MNLAQFSTRPLKWHLSGNPLFPYECYYNGVLLRLRLNDFPNEPMYTLMLGDAEGLPSFDDWPPDWKRPNRLFEAFDIARGFISEFFRRAFHRKSTPPVAHS